MAPEITPAQLTFTLCFLTRGEHVLLLHRQKPPNLGKWNGVGGHIEPGESPYRSCLREVKEETGFTLESLHFAGLLTWRGFEAPTGGLYLFTAAAPDGEQIESTEGRLQWRHRQWAFSAPEIVSNLHVVLPAVLDGAPPQVYDFDYDAGEITAQRILPLPAWVDVYRKTEPS